MTGTPDAETAWEELVARYPRGHPSMPDVDWAAMKAGFMEGFAAAEGPWREHLAQALRDAATDYMNRGVTPGYPGNVAAWLRVRADRLEPTDEFQDSED